MDSVKRHYINVHINILSDKFVEYIVDRCDVNGTCLIEDINMYIGEFYNKYLDDNINELEIEINELECIGIDKILKCKF